MLITNLVIKTKWRVNIITGIYIYIFNVYITINHWYITISKYIYTIYQCRWYDCFLDMQNFPKFLAMETRDLRCKLSSWSSFGTARAVERKKQYMVQHQHVLTILGIQPRYIRFPPNRIECLFAGEWSIQSLTHSYKTQSARSKRLAASNHCRMQWLVGGPNNKSWDLFYTSHGKKGMVYSQGTLALAHHTRKLWFNNHLNESKWRIKGWWHPFQRVLFVGCFFSGGTNFPRARNRERHSRSDCRGSHWYPKYLRGPRAEASKYFFFA